MSNKESNVVSDDQVVLHIVCSRWDEIKRDVRPHSQVVGLLLDNTKPIAVEGKTLILLVPSLFYKDNLEWPQRRRIVEEIIRRSLGAAYAIRCVITSSVGLVVQS